MTVARSQRGRFGDAWPKDRHVEFIGDGTESLTFDLMLMEVQP